MAPWSLALGAIALSVPALADQAGEARNDIVGIFFLLAAVAVALNAWSEGAGRRSGLGREEAVVPALVAWLVVGLAAGLAAGTKLNFLLPAAVLVVGLAADRAARGRVAGACCAGLAALAGGGYWYLRNLVHSGNPLPWIDSLGPISLPAPDQALGGREAHSVLGYLTDGAVWSDWFLPGLHDGLWILWPLLLVAALAGPRALPAAVARFLSHQMRERSAAWADLALALAGLVGLATALAWLVAPTSASGPDGMPRGFESGLRYLAPALVLGLALLPAAPLLRGASLARVAAQRICPRIAETNATRRRRQAARRRSALGAGAARASLVVALGYPVQRHYLENRYADPTFTTPGLNAAFAWARDVSDARIATTSTRQYPLFGTDLSNHVQFIGDEHPHGGFDAPTTCRAWRQRSTKATTTTSSPAATASNPASRPTHRRPAGPKAPEPKPSCASRRRSFSSSTAKLDPSACCS